MTTASLTETHRTRMRRHPERAVIDRETIYQILDAGRICHVAWVEDGEPVVLPTAYGRDGDSLILHGAVNGRFMKVLADGRRLCISVTHLDGLVLARSTFHSSMNFRSVALFGSAEEIVERDEQLQALDALVEHLAAGRSAEARGPNEKEMAATLVVRFPIEEGSAKIRTGPPIDAPGDLELPIWAGVVPNERSWGEPIAADGCEELAVPDSVGRLTAT
jgi:nitroimidazol reductase NimA-like FMN-containing flavoprotein (pyridoxamine 5'-phosphate oxidase superfamily)